MNPKCPGCPVPGPCPWDAAACATTADPAARRALFHLAGAFPGAEPGSMSIADAPIPPPTPRPTPHGPTWAPAAPGTVRVGLLAPVLNQGGAEAHMLTMARTVDRAAVSWRGCVVTNPEADPAMLAVLGAHMPVAVGREHARGLAAGCDVLVTWAISDLPGILAGLPRPPRVVAVVHAPPESLWGRSAYSRSEGIDRWVAVSELAMEAIPEVSRSVPATTIWNAVDVDRMGLTRSRAEVRRAWGVPEGAKVCGYLGRLSSEKRPEVMPPTADHLPPDWHVVVVGAGNRRESLAASPRCHLVGPDNLAGDVLNAFDCLVVPSEYESFCLTMAEGLWAGVPVISTPVGIAKIVPGLARLVPADAGPGAIAAAVIADEADPDGTAARVSRGLAFARERLSPARFGKAWGEFLCSLAPPRRIPPAAAATNPHMALLERVRACEHRGPALGCACNGLNSCGLGRGTTPGVIALQDCIRCLQGA